MIHAKYDQKVVDAAVEATRKCAIHDFYELESQIYNLKNMSVIVWKMIEELDKDHSSAGVKLEATPDEWFAILFAVDQIEKASKQLIESYTGAHNKACEFEKA